MTDPRPLCRCHGEPMSKDGPGKWGCRQQRRERQRRYQATAKGKAKRRVTQKRANHVYNMTERGRVRNRMSTRRQDNRVLYGSTLDVADPLGRELARRRLDSNVEREREYDAINRLIEEGQWRS